jgi:anaphase-promoting complex subunit 4
MAQRPTNQLLYDERAASLLPNTTPAASSTPSSTLTLSPEVLRSYTRHIFEPRFTPLKLIVNGRKGRRVVVVLGSDRKHYRVLDLDYKERKRTKGDAAEDHGAGAGPAGSGDGSSDWESDEEEGGDEDVEMGGA